MIQLFMYTRERTCGDQQLARLCLKEFGVPYTEINISPEADAAEELQKLIGCLALRKSRRVTPRARRNSPTVREDMAGSLGKRRQTAIH